MTRSIFLLLSSICFLIFSGCSSSLLLQADFENDEDESFPDTNLPGPPNGDRIFFSGPSDPPGGAPPLEVVRRDTSMWLKYFHQAGEGRPPFLLGFLTDGGIDEDDIYSISWRGEVSYTPSPNMDLRIWAAGGGSHGERNLVMFDLVREVDSSGTIVAGVYLVEDFRRTDRIGFVGTTGSHGFTITINMSQETYTIVGGNLGSVRSGTRQLPTGMDSNSPSLWFSFAAPGVGRYFIDDVTIQRVSR